MALVESLFNWNTGLQSRAQHSTKLHAGGVSEIVKKLEIVQKSKCSGVPLLKKLQDYYSQPTTGLKATLQNFFGSVQNKKDVLKFWKTLASVPNSVTFLLVFWNTFFMGCLFESFGKLLDGSVIEESSEFYNSIENSVT